MGLTHFEGENYSVPFIRHQTIYFKKSKRTKYYVFTKFIADSYKNRSTAGALTTKIFQPNFN